MICPDYDALQGPWETKTPVCANNGFTYGHVHQVRCLQDFNPTLSIVHEGGCSLREVKKVLGHNHRKKACMNKRRQFEKNPICTNMNQTYMNPFEVLCKRPKHVKERIGGICGCPYQRSCEKSSQLQKAIRFAPIKERQQFVVCGSDRKTYRSRHHLECARQYNSCKAFLHINFMVFHS